MTFLKAYKIHFYVLKNTLFFTLLCLLLLVMIETFFIFLNELQSLESDYKNITSMLFYIFYDIPVRIYRIFPMALLLGCLTGLGQLAASNELTAIRIAGFSKAGTITGAIIATLFLSFIIILFGEYITPISQHKAESYRKYQYEGKKFWAIDNNYFIQIGSIYDGDLKEVYLYKKGQSSLKEIIKAENATLNGKNWIIPHSTNTHITRDKITIGQEGFLVLPTLIDKNALNALTTAPEGLATSKLWRFIRYLDKNGLDSNEYRLAFWSKVLNPLTNLAMLVIAAPLVFAQSRHQGLGARILIGVILGLIIYLANQMIGHFILLSGYPPIIGASFPIILALVIAFILNKRSSN